MSLMSSASSLINFRGVIPNPLHFVDNYLAERHDKLAFLLFVTFCDARAERYPVTFSENSMLFFKTFIRT